jgi:hypothetical protein
MNQAVFVLRLAFLTSPGPSHSFSFIFSSLAWIVPIDRIVPCSLDTASIESSIPSSRVHFILEHVYAGWRRSQGRTSLLLTGAGHDMAMGVWK